MRKTLFIIGSLLLIISATIAVTIWTRPVEPVYNGKPVGYWLGQENLKYDFFGLGENLPKFDSKAIPYLLRASHRTSTLVDKLYAMTWSNSPVRLRRHLSEPSEVDPALIRGNAVLILAQVGTNSAPAIAGLMRVVKKDKSAMVRTLAVESLQKIGKDDPKVIEVVAAALKDRAPEVRDAAADALWQLDPDSAKKLLKK